MAHRPSRDSDHGNRGGGAVSEPERRVSYLIEQTPKDRQEWGYVETWPDGDQAARRIAVLRETRLGLLWDFRLVQVDEVRTVVE